MFPIELIPGKQCTKCKVWLPATLGYWYYNKEGKYGLHSPCKNCCKLKTKNYNTVHKTEKSKQNKLYRESNKEKIKIKRKNFYIKNKEKIDNRNNKWVENNKEKSKLIKQRWSKSHLKYGRLASQKRNARKKHLPDTLTLEQMEYLYKYFDNKCLVCGSITKLTLDHWVPLTNENCFGTVVVNIVLLCKSCNSSKCNSLPTRWLMQKFKNGYFTFHIFVKVFNYFKKIQNLG